jgi:hypothetical protein
MYGNNFDDNSLNSAKSQVSGLPKKVSEIIHISKQIYSPEIATPKCNVSEGLECLLKRVVSALVFIDLKCPVPGTILAFRKLLLKSYISGAVYCYLK